LPIVLPQIEKVIPFVAIHKKFIVDDFSTDSTVQVAENLGWKVFCNKKKGLTNAQNLALSLVETDYYAVFEHDVFLSAKWFPAIPSLVLSGKYGIAQGIRLRDVAGFRICINISISFLRVKITHFTRKMEKAIGLLKKMFVQSILEAA
jgi:glycosyltransferase involved in cell wall biosynthesis